MSSKLAAKDGGLFWIGAYRSPNPSTRQLPSGSSANHRNAKTRAWRFQASTKEETTMGEMLKIKPNQTGPCPVTADLFRHIAGEEQASAEELALESYLEGHDYVEAFMEAYPARRQVGMSVFRESDDKINDVLLAVVEGRFTEARQAILGAVLDVLEKQREESQIEH